MPINCKCCGKDIDHVLVDSFNREGDDSYKPVEITRVPGTQAIVFETDQHWTGYELSDDEEEMRATIQCPECHQYPFDDEIHAEDIVQVIMFTDQPEEPQTELDKLVESLARCSGGEPCCNKCPMKSEDWKRDGKVACEAYSEDSVSVPKKLVEEAVNHLIAQAEIINECEIIAVDNQFPYNHECEMFAVDRQGQIVCAICGKPVKLE